MKKALTIVTTETEPYKQLGWYDFNIFDGQKLDIIFVVNDNYKLINVYDVKQTVNQYTFKIDVDSSNEKDKYTRNRYRKYVLPILKEEYKDAKLFFDKYAFEDKYVMLWLCENDGTKICEIESHKPALKTKEEILAFMKESWGEEAVTEYVSHDGKQCYRVFGSITHFLDLCERAHIEWKWVGDFQMTAKGSDFELEYCESDIILAFEK